MMTEVNSITGGRRPRVSHINICAQFEAGKSVAWLVNRHGVKSQQIILILRKAGLLEAARKGGFGKAIQFNTITVAEPKPMTLPPPSRAMINLAQFDPIVARALELRKGTS